ncbi:MAG: glycerol-3-phosphate acyltransferase [Dehalococcoidia bacterium]|nr:glycerol-3-phosphate acyltransferase [Dehalococcoidia bacterium]MDD5647684.1 glycerol-3-phosphate acyltransferase [Dehalococcoidia bacterium]
MINIVLAYVISAIESYLLGCIPSAYLVGRSFKGVDIRQIGSRNMGAMNTFYAIGFWPGMLVLATDICKAMLALTLSYFITIWLQVPPNVVVPVEMVAGIAVIAGHNFPVFLKFKGGKGGATAIGVLAFLLAWINWVDIGSIKLPIPLGDLIYLGSFLILLAITRWPTVSYAVSYIAFWVIAWFVYKDTALFIYSIFISAVPILMYIPRIKEIWNKSGGNAKRAIFRTNLKDRM